MDVNKSRLAVHLGLPADASESLIRARLRGIEGENEVKAAGLAQPVRARVEPQAGVEQQQKPLSITRSVGGHTEHRPGGLGFNVDAEESLIEAFRRPVDLVGQVDLEAVPPGRDVGAVTEQPAEPVDLADGPATGWFDGPRYLGWTRIAGPPLPRG